MKFSENWLRSHVPTSISREQLLVTLTAIGLEVEESTVLGETLQQVVVARIVETAPHPQADRLQVCRVDAGLEQPLQIVCGAPNARVGLVAPLALVGAQVGELQIKPARLRGVESSGMLCSAKELGLDADASGLLELPADAPVGQSLADYLGLPDASIEIKLTPNRADCFSVRGIAFDVAAATGCSVEPLATEPVPAQSDATLTLELQAGAKVPRFVGRVIDGIDASRPTPLWMAERLRRAGLRPISFLVDVTQYVMLELGQPMHAFDRDSLQEPLVVRPARAGERLTLLDERSVSLDSEFLVVADSHGGHGARAVALGGIMGGAETRVGAATQRVFLEAAHWLPSAIIGRSRRLGLHTDAAHRFERGVDPQLPRLAIEYATRLILDVAGGVPGPVLETVREQDLGTNQPILLRRARIARVLGIEIADAEIERILVALGMTVSAVEAGWQVIAPSRRFDIAIEEDLIEELVRIHGYDRIPTTLPGGASRIAMPSESRMDEAELRRQLVARDLLETINYAFVDAGLLARWQMDDGSLALANPLSAELAVMRPSLLPGLVAALGRNVARQIGRVRLFELGKVFSATATGEPPQERLQVALAVCGEASAEQWSLATRKVDFHDLNGDLASLAAASGARLDYRPSARPFAHPQRSADVYRDDEYVGWIGQLHPRLLAALEIDVEVIAAELDYQALARRALPRASDLSRFPSVRRDLAFLVPDDQSWAGLETSVRSVVGGWLRELRLFDRYLGPGVEKGFKSLAIGLILQDNSRTLTDRDVDEVVAAVVAVVERDHHARIRG